MNDRELVMGLHDRIDALTDERDDLRSNLNTTVSRLSASLAENVRLREVVEEFVEPGVFGPWHEVEDPRLKHSEIEVLCEDNGYGAVLHHVAWMWARAHPDSAHTVAACVAVRRKMIEKACAALGAKGADGG